MMNLSDLSDEDLSAIADNQLTKVSDEGLKVIAETPKISMSPLGAMGRGAIRGILPTAAGFVSGSAGAIAGAPAGPAGAIAGGLGLGLAGATATAAAQQKVLEKFPGVAGMVGLSPEEQAVMERHFPYTSLIGESAVGLAGATPTRALFGKGTQEAVRTARTQAAIGAGANVGTEAAVEKLQGEDLDWKRLGLATAFGAAGQKTTGVGEKLSALGEKIGRPVATRVTEPLRTAIRGPRPEAPAVPPAAEPIAMPDADELSAHTVNGKRLTKGEWEEHRRSIGLPPREGAQPAETDLTPPKVPESDWHDTESSMNELLGRKPAEPVEPPKAEVPKAEAPKAEEPPVKPAEEVKAEAAKDLTAKDYEDAALKFERQALGAGDLAEAARLLEIAHRLRLRASDLTPKAPPTETKTPEPPPADQAGDVVVQNRDRSAPGYVAQMNEIASKPRYADVSHSRNVTFGAPVVTGDNFRIPAEHYGRQDNVTLINGSEVPVRYAVVDARDVLASHNVSGGVNKDYDLPDAGKLKAVAGNGRAAGLAEGWNRNTMGGYKESFLADDLHGIDPEVIRGMERPMLVRVTPEQEVRSRPNWGDLTNISAGAELTPLEKAKNDSRRIDLTKIELSPNGSITHDTVKQFINAMPTQEQNNLMDSRSGAPNTLAYDRLNAAIFHKAYGNDDLVNLAYHATDADARNVLNALAKAAPHMMGLEKTPYDIRPRVAEAAELAVNAARNGIPLDVAARQIDINTDPVTHHILEHFGENRRSAKKMAEYLDRVATMAKAENAGGAEDMFGAKQQRSIEQILQEARTEPTDQEALFSRRSTEGKGTFQRTSTDEQDFRKRTPEVEQALKDLQEGRITDREYDEVVATHRAVRPYSEVPRPASHDEMVNALHAGKRETVGLPSRLLQDGHSVGLRLDIPAYTEHGVWVPTIHEKGAGSGGAGTKIGHEATAVVNDASFVVNQGKAEKIAGKTAKSPIATIEGKWENRSTQDAANEANAAMQNKDWVQVGMDPFRHSFFYDRSDMRPLVSADRVIQIGPLVLAKNPVYGKRSEMLFSRMSTEGKGAPVELNRPGVPFKDGMAFSPGVDRRIAGLAQAFRKDLGIGADVYVTTMRDANRDLAKFKEQYAKVVKLASDPRNAGVVQQMPDGSWVMLLEDSASWAHRVETLAHEFGHIHEKEYFAHQPKAVKDAIYGEFDGWLEDSGFRTAREHVASLRARKAAKMTDIPNPQKTGADLDPYWRKFEEWYADQVSRWATTSERPLGLVGQFFHRLAESMKAFYSKLRNAKYLPNSTFKDYMDGVHERHYPNGTGEMAGPSYSKKVAETRITKPVINYKGHAIGAPTWDLPPPEKLFGFLKKGDWYTKLVDNSYNLGQATKEARRAAAESERGFNEDFDPHTKMMLYRPREAKAKLNFLEKYVEPWAEKFREANKKLGVTREDFHNYMLAKHAEEANAHIRNIGGMEDGGSGMTDAAAREFLANLPADKRQALEGLGQRAQEMLAQTRKVLLEGQLQSADDIAAMEGYYQNYVPLNRKEGELDFVRDYKGIQGSAAVRGDFARRRKGSAKEVNDIMENIILQHERAIKKAEHNRVRLALYGMALQNPNKNFMTALNPDAIKDQVKAHEELTRLGVDPREGMDMIAMRGMPKSARLTQSETGPKVQFKMDPSKLNSQNVISLRVNGQDRFVVMNANDPAALQAALAIKGADLKVLGPWMGSIARVTRFLASVNTQYNPVFGLWNFARDTIAAPFNMTVSDLADRKGEVMKNIMPAMGGLFKEIRNPEATGYWADRVRQWKKAGGKTQYAPSFKGIEQEAIVLGDALKRLDRNTLHKAAAATFRGLAHYNDMMEGAVRVSAFDASLKKQMAAAGVERPTQPMLDKAALSSQEVTVNFNKHGSNTQTFSALFAFFSSALQGANKTLDVLHGPSGRKIMAGGMALGMFQSMLLAWNDFDENQPSSYMKNKNFIIPTGDGKYIMIPYPLGLNILPSLGRTISDAALRSAGVITGTKSAGERAADVLGVFSDAFNPLGGGTLIQTMTPTIADPFVAVAQNKDAFGRPISREDMPSRPTPGYLRSRENASAAGNLIAEALNRISGGTEFQKGQISPTADDLDYLAGQALGGAYREAKKGVETVKSGFTGEEQPLHKIPVVGKMVGDINDPASVAAQFYQNIKTMYGYKQEIQGRMKERQDVGEFLRETPEARLWSAAENFENRISELNKTRKEMIKREAAPELIKRIDDTKTRAMNQFNELVRRAQR